MANNEGVDMITSQMGSLKCQENDKKILTLKKMLGTWVPHCVQLVLGLRLIVSITRNP